MADDILDESLINFPYNIQYESVEQLCRYLALKLKGNCKVEFVDNNRIAYQKRSDLNEDGEILHRLEDVFITPGKRELRGVIRRSKPVFSVAEFMIKNECTDSENDLLCDCDSSSGSRSYTGMRLLYGLSDFDEVGKPEIELVRDIRGVVEDYFKEVFSSPGLINNK